MRWLSIVFCGACLTACGGEAPSSVTEQQARADEPPGPCSLLAPAEAEAVLGPLAGAPYRARLTTPDAGGDLCRFENEELRSLVISVVWENGAQELTLLNAVSAIVNAGDLGALRLVDGTTLAGEWDEARVVGCCELDALRGDQLVKVDVAGTRATLADAARLADAALRRLDAPLAVDDRAASDAAGARMATRPRIRPVCDLVPRAQAEEIFGGALMESPAGDDTSCTYRGDELDLTLSVQWRDGFRDRQVIDATVGTTASFIGLPRSDEAEAGPWDEYSSSIVGVMAVKRDVLVSVETGPFGQSTGRAFVERAIRNLTPEGVNR